MAEYALVGPKGIDRIATDIEPGVQTKPGFRWVPVESKEPAHDDETEVKTSALAVRGNKVDRVWTVRDKTQEERADDKERKISALNGSDITLHVMLHLRNQIAALKGEPALNKQQFRREIRDTL